MNSRQLSFLKDKLVLQGRIYKFLIEPKGRDVSGPQVGADARWETVIPGYPVRLIILCFLVLQQKTWPLIAESHVQ